MILWRALWEYVALGHTPWAITDYLFPALTQSNTHRNPVCVGPRPPSFCNPVFDFNRWGVEVQPRPSVCLTWELISDNIQPSAKAGKVCSWNEDLHLEIWGHGSLLENAGLLALVVWGAVTVPSQGVYVPWALVQWWEDCRKAFWNGNAGAVLDHHGEERDEKAKLSIKRFAYVPTHTYGHQLWVVIEALKSRGSSGELPRSASEMGWGAETSDQSRTAALWHWKKPDKAFRASAFEVFQACPSRPRLQGRPVTRWRDHISLGDLDLGVPRKRWKVLLVRKWCGTPCWTCCYRRPTLDKREKKWMDGF